MDSLYTVDFLMNFPGKWSAHTDINEATFGCIEHLTNQYHPNINRKEKSSKRKIMADMFSFT